MKQLILFIWIILGIYIGVGGWTKANLEQLINSVGKESSASEPVEYDGITFNNKYQLEMFIQEEKANEFFPWIFYLPDFLGLVLTAGAFGSLGGVINILKQIAVDKKNIGELNVFAKPMFGFFVGLMLLGIAHILPAAITFNESEVRPVSLLFLCLFGGIFSERFFKWIEDTVKNIIK